MLLGLLKLIIRETQSKPNHDIFGKLVCHTNVDLVANLLSNYVA